MFFSTTPHSPALHHARRSQAAVELATDGLLFTKSDSVLFEDTPLLEWLQYETATQNTSLQRLLSDASSTIEQARTGVGGEVPCIQARSTICVHGTGACGLQSHASNITCAAATVGMPCLCQQLLPAMSDIGSTSNPPPGSCCCRR